MNIFARLADLSWEGLTLKHIAHKKIRQPYILFMILALLFEIFLLGLMVVSFIFFVEFHYLPSFAFFICMAIMVTMLFLTVGSLVGIFRK